MDKNKALEMAVDEIVERETKDCDTMERIAITIACLNIVGMLSGMPMSTKLRIARIISGYLHVADGLLKE